MKKCIGCNEIKGYDLFYKKTSSSDKVGSYCKICDSTRRKQRHLLNKENDNEKCRKYYADNSDKLKNDAKNYRMNNVDKVKESKRKYSLSELGRFHSEKWKIDNRERYLFLKKKYNSKNKDKTNFRVKNRLHNDEMFKCKLNIRNLIRLSLNRGGYKKSSKTNAILDCSFEFFRNHIESQFIENMSWDNRSEWHLDHIIPISSAKTEADVIRLNHWSNFQPLWAADNLAKSDTMPPQDIIDEVNMIYECCKLN